MRMRCDSQDGGVNGRVINQETNNGIEASNQLDALARKMGSPIRNARYGGASNERTARSPSPGTRKWARCSLSKTNRP